MSKAPKASERECSHDVLACAEDWMHSGMQLREWLHHARLRHTAAERAEAAEGESVEADDVRWIVNDIGELGVEVRGRCFFLYKGGSLEYEDGSHDDGSPMLYRAVGKREFGEVCYPADWYTQRPQGDGGRYTREVTPGAGRDTIDPEYHWRSLPNYKPATPDASWLDGASLDALACWLDDCELVTRKTARGWEWCVRDERAHYGAWCDKPRTAYCEYLRERPDQWPSEESRQHPELWEGKR